MSQRARFRALLAVWVAVLLFMAGSKQYTIATGTKIYLEVVPVDPYDPFMGAYAQLAYDISRIMADPATGFGKGDEVFTTLEERDGVWKSAQVSSVRPPAGTLYIKGIVLHTPQSINQIVLADIAGVDPEDWARLYPEEAEKLAVISEYYFAQKPGEAIYFFMVNNGAGWSRQFGHYPRLEDARRNYDLYYRSYAADRRALVSARVTSVQPLVAVNVRYGIEKFFAPADKSRKYELLRNQRKLLAEVYLDSDGSATLGSLVERPSR